MLNEEIFDLKGGLTEKLQQKGMDDAAGTVEKYIRFVKMMDWDVEEQRYVIKNVDWYKLDKEDDCKLMMDMLLEWGGSESVGSKYVECFWNMHSQ